MFERKQELNELTLAFLDAFNRNDLDGVMAFFTDDIVYDELDGTRSSGREAVRAAFADQFAGKFGAMKFIEDDTFIDADAGAGSGLGQRYNICVPAVAGALAGRIGGGGGRLVRLSDR